MSASADFNPLDNPDVWDTIAVGSMVNPGICKIGDIKRKNTWDVKKGKGTLGATITFVGRDPIEFTITFYLWLPEHFTEWGEFRKQFEFDPTKKGVSAVGVFHPALADIGIDSVVTESIGALKNEGKNMWTIEVGLLEYFPPPKKAATGTPNGSKSSGANNGAKPPGTPSDPIADAQQAEIARLLKQANP